jgi:hypothetical protein
MWAALSFINSAGPLACFAIGRKSSPAAVNNALQRARHTLKEPLAA